MRLTIVVLLGAVAVGVADRADAQSRNRPRSRSSALNNLTRPGVSPYLNLLRTEFEGVPNYQTLVRPLVDERNTSLNNQTAIRQLEQAATVAPVMTERGINPNVRATGHSVLRMDTAHYFGGGGGRRR